MPKSCSVQGPPGQTVIFGRVPVTKLFWKIKKSIVYYATFRVKDCGHQKHFAENIIKYQIIRVTIGG